MTTPSSVGYNPYNSNAFRQMLDLTVMQTNNMAYSYRTLGLEYHALPLAIRNSPQLTPDLKTVCIEAFLVLQDGSPPIPVLNLRMLREEIQRAGEALAADQLAQVDRILRNADTLRERMQGFVQRLVGAMREYGDTAAAEMEYGELSEMQRRVEMQRVWIDCLPWV
ncbi:hypothetical protein LTR85_002346 [Meristemomyces frigidus]|nr:hypothetical protein LTR85_002346 [Meristemomyces frigidus]